MFYIFAFERCNWAQMRLFSWHNACVSFPPFSLVGLSFLHSSSGGDVSSVATTTAESEDESFARKNKRYRCIKDLYSVTTPVVKAKRKRNKCVGTRK